MISNWEGVSCHCSYLTSLEYTDHAAKAIASVMYKISLSGKSNHDDMHVACKLWEMAEYDSLKRNHIEVTNEYDSTMSRRRGSFPFNNFVAKGKNAVPKEPMHVDIRCIRTATLKQPDHRDVIIARIRLRENVVFRINYLQWSNNDVWCKEESRNKFMDYVIGIKKFLCLWKKYFRQKTNLVVVVIQSLELVWRKFR